MQFKYRLQAVGDEALRVAYWLKYDRRLNVGEKIVLESHDRDNIWEVTHVDEEWDGAAPEPTGYVVKAVVDGAGKVIDGRRSNEPDKMAAKKLADEQAAQDAANKAATEKAAKAAQEAEERALIERAKAEAERVERASKSYRKSK